MKQAQSVCLWIAFGGWLIVAGMTGCTSAPDPVDASVAATLVPVMASHESAYSGNNLSQESVIAAGSGLDTFSTEVTFHQLSEISKIADPKFQSYWLYIGSKGMWHYLAFHPAFGMRKIYRIHESQYSMPRPFDLTGVASSWRKFQVPRFFEYSSVLWSFGTPTTNAATYSTNHFDRPPRLLLGP